MFIYPYNVDKHEIFLKFSLQLPYENFLDPRMVSLFITIPFLNIKKNKRIRFQSVILCNVQNCWKTRNTIFVTKSGKKKHYHKKTEINSSLLTSPSHSIREIGYAAMTLGFFSTNIYSVWCMSQ